jgi:tRNA 2-selenouridine synthase
MAGFRTLRHSPCPDIPVSGAAPLLRPAGTAFPIAAILLYNAPMPIALTSLADIPALGFDTIIDVRSPSEWADDHVPGAVSLPVLDDAERARVGTIYKQVSPFTARKLGAALVARNAALHLEGPLADMPGGWRPLVYCWRGGQRSGSFATILSQIGWRVETLAGGYKAYRALVVQAMYNTPFPARVILIDGNTGSGKTALLPRLAAIGVQVIDLEGLARHRGSLFGGMAGGQPSQRTFEGALAAAAAALDPARPVVIEAESAKIGDLRLPPALWKAMLQAPRIEIAAPAAARAAHLLQAYPDMVADAARLDGILTSLKPLHPAELIAEWRSQAATGDFAAMAAGLMTRHYDPRYARHRARSAPPVAVVTAASLDAGGLDRLAGDLARAVASLE